MTLILKMILKNHPFSFDHWVSSLELLIFCSTMSGESFEFKLFVKQLNGSWRFHHPGAVSEGDEFKSPELPCWTLNPEPPCATFPPPPFLLFLFLVKISTDFKKEYRKLIIIVFFLHLQLDHFLGYICQVSIQKILINRVPLHWLLSIHI